MLKQHWKWTLAVLVVLGISISLILLQKKSSHEAAITSEISNKRTEQKPAETMNSPVKETAQGEHQHNDEQHAQPTHTEVLENSVWLTQAQIDEIYRKFKKEAEILDKQGHTNPNNPEHRKAVEAFKEKVDAFAKRLSVQVENSDAIRLNAFVKMDDAIAEPGGTSVENQKRIVELNKIIAEQRAILNEGSSR